ncbi:MAG: DUF1330 domain-containing protein [Alphaproteobacteria bacterium]
MEPTPEHLAALAADDRPGPVVMLNLVKFKDGADARAEYQTYSKGFTPLLKQLGGTVLWAGDVTGIAIGEDGRDDWDYAVLVRYPRRQDFVDTMTSDAYAAINPYRLAGLAKHVIVPVSETYSKFDG